MFKLAVISALFAAGASALQMVTPVCFWQMEAMAETPSWGELHRLSPSPSPLSSFFN
jgi:hypothetical protein